MKDQKLFGMNDNECLKANNREPLAAIGFQLFRNIVSQLPDMIRYFFTFHRLSNQTNSFALSSKFSRRKLLFFQIN